MKVAGRALILVLAASAVPPRPSLCQQAVAVLTQTTSQRPSKASETVPLSILQPNSEPERTEAPAVGILGRVVCDGSGNMYFRLMRPDYVSAIPVTRMSADGRITGQFDLTKVPDFSQRLMPLVFAVDSGGALYAIASTDDDKVYLLAYSRPGDFAWKVRIPSDINVSQIVPLPTGDFLLSGSQTISNKKSSTKRPLVALIDREGRISRDLSDSKDSARAADALETPYAELADDGNLYSIQPGVRTTVRVFSTDGALIRTFRLQPPFEDAKPEDLFMVGGRMLLIYQSRAASKETPFRIEYALYSSLDGELLARYQFKLKGFLACANADGLSFLTMGRDGNFEISHGQLQ